MTALRRFTLLSTLSLAATGVVTPAAFAQLVPAVENAKFGAAGTVNAMSVAVHSGPGENYYPTMHLDKGATVTVVGVKFDWLKILPPEGSFSYIAKQFVEKTGENTGRISRPNVNVRVGSSLTPLKAAIQCQMQANDPVVILGEAEEYYKIKPPAGAFLFINKQYVDAAKMLGPTADLVKAPPQTTGSVAVTPPAATSDATPSIPTTPPPAVAAANAANDAAPQGTDTKIVPSDNVGAASLAGTGPAAGAAKDDPNAATADKLASSPTTGKTEISAALDAYTKAEQDFMAASQQPLDQQPLAQLTETYTALAANEKLPSSVRNNAQIRLQTLKFRTEAQQGVLAVRKSQDAAKQRTASLEAEQKALQAKLNGTRVLVYTAMGQLSTSSLKLGDTPIFRLVDPANGRTLVYIRGTDPSLPGLLNQFVGVKGDIVTDPQLSLSIITPKSIEQVDPTKTDAAAAQIQPASLKATASTNDK